MTAKAEITTGILRMFKTTLQPIFADVEEAQCQPYRYYTFISAHNIFVPMQIRRHVKGEFVLTKGLKLIFILGFKLYVLILIK